MVVAMVMVMVMVMAMVTFFFDADVVTMQSHCSYKRRSEAREEGVARTGLSVEARDAREFFTDKRVATASTVRGDVHKWERLKQRNAKLALERANENRAMAMDIRRGAMERRSQVLAARQHQAQSTREEERQSSLQRRTTVLATVLASSHISIKCAAGR